MKRELKRLRDDLNNNRDILKSVYKYCFDFAKKKNRKDIDLPIAQGLWDTLLTNTFPIMKKFMNYVGVRIIINLDNRRERHKTNF